jgi:uncharacterized SAM-binding protein YcdF (DUF218 family)
MGQLRKLPIRRAILSLVALWLVTSLSLGVVIHVYGGIDHARPSDVIIVLGAGVNRNNTPSVAQRVRTNRAADLYQQGLADHILCAGGLPGYATVSEAQTCRDILLQRGVPDSAIALEDKSRSTQENASYADVVMQAQGWRTAIVVSDAYHLLRSQWLFSSEGIDSYTSPVDESYLRPGTTLYTSAREVLAFEWLIAIKALNLPFTYVPLV